MAMNQEIELEHCPEAQEVLGKIPGWIIRWGLAVVFLLFAGLLGGCYFIRYPQVMKVPLELAGNGEADSGNIRICAVVPFENIGKIAVGQTVRRIRIGSDAFTENGLLTGTVDNISDIPTAEGYRVSVILPQAYSDTLSRLSSASRMIGTGEIVLSDMSLLEHLLQPIRYISSHP